jgi:hypothetical protein
VALARTIWPFEFQGIEKSCLGGGGDGERTTRDRTCGIVVCCMFD